MDVIELKKVIKNQRFGEERALYNLCDTKVIDGRVEGEEDGESALKEASNIELENVYMDLRYPLWHVDNAKMDNVCMTENCRAAIWYSKNFTINNSILGGIKAVRECSNIDITNSKIKSLEFGWKSSNVSIKNSELVGEYLFLDSNNITIDNLKFTGKYSFQYVNNLIIRNSAFKTKDAFWHADNVTVYDTVLEGEYLAWYSKNVTLVRCHIKGTQPFCYCDNLKLIDCTMEDTDLSFENSEVYATIKGNVKSIKNPRLGRIELDSLDEFIIEDNKFEIKADIIIKEAE
jgi:hypothetical protein